MRRCMRTTITLEDDVVAELNKVRKGRTESFKQTLNAVLRAGLTSMRRRRTRGSTPHATTPVSLGKPRLSNLDDISEVLAFAEGEDHR